jgi:superfamily II DNA or RNA helicase
MQLRTYQLEAIQNAREALRKGQKRIILHAPTGAGKTLIACEIIKSAVGKGKRVLFLAHRKELIDQAVAKLDDAEIPIGIIMRKHWRTDPGAPVQVASVQTLIRRQVEEDDLIIIDETPLALAKSYMDIVKQSPLATVVGLTATPVRLDGRGLGEIYQQIIPVRSVHELIDDGFLVPIVHYAPKRPMLGGISMSQGDYNAHELEEAIDQPDLVGDIYSHWQKLASDRQTIIFCVSIEHSKNIAAQFQAKGVRFAHIDGTMPGWERDRIFEDLASGALQGISNVGICCEGYDNPSISCIVLARPTKSLALFLQQAGRGLRPYKGKRDCVILDHAGCAYDPDLGLVDEIREWSLEGRKRKSKEAQDKVPTVKICEKCFAAYAATARKCPQCGYANPAQVRELVEDKEGELSVVSAEGIAIHKERRAEERVAKTLEDWMKIAQVRGYKPRWAHIRYNLRMGRR